MSVYSVTNALADASTAANFKTFCQPISDALSSSNFNWTPAYSVSTVGGAGGNGARITWASVTAVPSSVGDLYEIWAMNDGSNQTSCPFYIRMDYYNDGSNNKVGVAVGQGYSSSTGLLTGTNGETYTMQTSSNGSGTTYTHYFSGSTSSFRMQLYTDKSGDGQLMIVERSKSSAGADTASYVACGLLGNDLSGNSRFVIIPATGTTLNSGQRWPVPPYDASSAAFGTNVAVFPVLPVSTTVGSPMLGAGIGKQGDFSTQSNASISVVAYGSTHTYKVMNNSINSRAMYDTNDANVLMQYE
jgi:hypothetical protein